MASYNDQLTAWSAAAEYQKVADAIREIPDEQRDYEQTCLLAWALENLLDYGAAVGLLLGVREQGRGDPDWFYRLGYAYYHLELEAQAKPLFLRAAELDAGRSDALDFVEACDYQLSLKAAKADAVAAQELDPDWDGDDETSIPFDDPDYILDNLRKNIGGSDATVIDGALVMTDWRVNIRASLERLDNNGAAIYYTLCSPDWDRRMFDCSVGAGSSYRRSFQLAQSGFLYGMLEGVQVMASERPFERLETQFVGEKHCWSAYRSNLLGLGDSPQMAEYSFFWELLRDDVLKRIGNQKICYVKIYCSRQDDIITGECRINNIDCPRLSQKVSDYVHGWDNKYFGAQKQFVFLKQEDSTYSAYPYEPEQLADYTRQAIRMFGMCVMDDRFENCMENLTRKIGDIDLAEELCVFLPEMCAVHAYPNIDFGETLHIRQHGEISVYYKTQLSSYYPIHDALMIEMGREYFTDELYQALVSLSRAYNEICNAKTRGIDLTQGGSLSPVYTFSDTYHPR